MALEKIRRWGIIFLHDFNKSVAAFRRWLLRESLLEPDDIAGGKAPMAVGIMGAHAVDQAQSLQRRQMIVQGRDRYFRILGQSRRGRETAEILVVPVAQIPQHDLGCRLQPALLDGPVGGGVAYGRSRDKEKGRVMNTGPDRVGRGRKRLA